MPTASQGCGQNGMYPQTIAIVRPNIYTTMNQQVAFKDLFLDLDKDIDAERIILQSVRNVDSLQTLHCLLDFKRHTDVAVSSTT